MSAPLDPRLLLRGYAAGIFPMADSRDAGDIFWVEPRSRAIIPLESFHLSRSLARRVRSGSVCAAEGSGISIRAGAGTRCCTCIRPVTAAFLDQVHDFLIPGAVHKVVHRDVHCAGGSGLGPFRQVLVGYHDVVIIP